MNSVVFKAGLAACWRGAVAGAAWRRWRGVGVVPVASMARRGAGGVARRGAAAMVAESVPWSGGLAAGGWRGWLGIGCWGACPRRVMHYAALAAHGAAYPVRQRPCSGVRGGACRGFRQDGAAWRLAWFRLPAWRGSGSLAAWRRGAWLSRDAGSGLLPVPRRSRGIGCWRCYAAQAGSLAWHGWRRGASGCLGAGWRRWRLAAVRMQTARRSGPVPGYMGLTARRRHR